MDTKQLTIRILLVLFWFSVIGTFVASPRFGFLTPRKSINICAWSGMFDLQWIARFEKETGIHVNLSYYESNEELLVKLHTTKSHGYDLIVPSDYTIRILRKEGIVKKLDKTKLDFYQHLNPLLIGHYFDETNDYSVPFEWSVYGLGMNTKCYPQGVDDYTWGLIFDKKLIDSHKIMMTNDPLIAVPLAALYLYGSVEDLSKKRIYGIEHLLKRQHPLVEAYADFRASYYLASDNACLAVCSSSLIFKAMREYPHLQFIIPHEGSLVTIESFAIPCSSQKDDLVYSFMNFMMKPESVAHSYETMGFFPATTNVLDRLDLQPQVHSLLTMSEKEFKRFHLLRFDQLKKVLCESELQDLWVRIKA